MSYNKYNPAWFDEQIGWFVDLLEELAEQDSRCQYDRHGNCETHGSFRGDNTCPHDEAQRIVDAWRNSAYGRR